MSQEGQQAATSQPVWIETTGGPHLLIAEELLIGWRGVEGWRDHEDPDDKSDYARACRVESWLGLIPCGAGEVVVFSGEAGPIAWFDDEKNDSGVFIQWVGADSDAQIAAAVRSGAVLRCLTQDNAEDIAFSAGASGRLRLMDSSDVGADPIDSALTIDLQPGRYRLRAGYFETESLMLVVRALTRG